MVNQSLATTEQSLLLPGISSTQLRREEITGLRRGGCNPKMLPSSQHKRCLTHKPHTLHLITVGKLYNLGNKFKKCNLATSHFGQLPETSHNSRAPVKFIEAAHNQTAFHRKDTESEGERAEGGRPG